MMNKTTNALLILTTVILWGTQNNLSAQPENLNTLIVDKVLLDELKSSFASGLKHHSALIKSILKSADKLMNKRALSVTEKTITPPSGDKHDFTSMGPYWWPDPSKMDGLPYIRRDGERNPEYYKIPDESYFTKTVDGSLTLAVAFYISGNSKYAEKSAELLRVWFLDEKTRMNPNMKHAQFIPGLNDGRGIGLIETRTIYQALDAVILLRGSSVWKNEYDQKFTDWMEEYYTWITTHQYGIDEYNEKNNHGTWYDVQSISIALFLGKYETVKENLEIVKTKRIDSQIETDGKQPLELARTKSWNYSCMNLSAFMHLALLAEHAGIDLWNYQSPNGGSIRKALDFLLPFTQNFEKWEYKQIDKFETESLRSLLFYAVKKIDKDIYIGWYKKLFGNEPEATIDELMF